MRKARVSHNKGAKVQTLDQFKATIPKGGLLNEGLRGGLSVTGKGSKGVGPKGAGPKSSAGAFDQKALYKKMYPGKKGK